MAARVITEIMDATPLKVAGIVVISATIAVMTGRVDSESYVNIILTILGYGFGHAMATQKAKMDIAKE